MFIGLKLSMTQVPVLAMPNFQALFVIETDASHHGLGAVLLQEKHPIAFFSKVLGLRASGKSIYEKELMAIVFAVLKWKHYLMGRRFLVRTDQKSSKHLLEQREINGDYQKWMMKLMAFDFVIEYNPGKHNNVADALSRISQLVMEFGALLSSHGIDWQLLQEEVKKDATLVCIRQGLQKGEPNSLGFTLENDILFYNGLYVLAKSLPFISVLLREYHDSPYGGHMGELKTYLQLAREWTATSSDAICACMSSVLTHQSFVPKAGWVVAKFTHSDASLGACDDGPY